MSDLIELSTRFGPLDLREGGTITYAWPEDKTRNFQVGGARATLDPHEVDGGALLKATWWYLDNAIFRLRSIRSTKPVVACPLSALSRRGYFMRPVHYDCGIAQMQSEIEIVGDVPANTHPHVVVDFALYGTR